MALRTVQGVEFNDKPKGQEKFARESTRWRHIVDGIRCVDDNLPANSYRLHVSLMAALVMAELKRREVAEDERTIRKQLHFRDFGTDAFGRSFPG